MVKLYGFGIVFNQIVSATASEVSRASAPLSNLMRTCNLCSSVRVKHTAISFKQRGSFTLHCISVVTFISKVSNNIKKKFTNCP